MGKRDRSPSPAPDPDIVLGKNGRIDRAATAKKRKNREDDERAAADALVAQKNLNFANLRSSGTTMAGTRKNGDLNLTFIAVGQGDCAVMSTPDGTVLLFDCGSDSLESEAEPVFRKRLQDILTHPVYAGPEKVIDILISTHPDTDHYNKLKKVLGTEWTIGVWYHSAERPRYSGGTSSFLIDRLGGEEANAMHVVLNRDDFGRKTGERTINKKDIATFPASGGCPRPDTGNGIQIVAEAQCDISILAADVHHIYDGLVDNSNDTNRGSIVTLIRCKGKRILMCGDATVHTERFLLNTAVKRIEDLYLLQAGHHGSINTSSSPDFRKTTRPDIVIASAGRKIPMHNLPSKAVIKEYQDQMARLGKAECCNHETFYYTPGGGPKGYLDESSFSTYRVYTTGSWAKPFEVTL